MLLHLIGDIHACFPVAAFATMSPAVFGEPTPPDKRSRQRLRSARVCRTSGQTSGLTRHFARDVPADLGDDYFSLAACRCRERTPYFDITTELALLAAVLYSGMTGHQNHRIGDHRCGDQTPGPACAPEHLSLYRLVDDLAYVLSTDPH